MKIDIEKREESVLGTAFGIVVQQTIGLVWLSCLIKAPLWKLFKATFVVAVMSELTALDVAAVVYFLQQMAAWEGGQKVVGMGAGNWTGR